MFSSHIHLATMRQRGTVPTHRLLVRFVFEHRQCIVSGVLCALVLVAGGGYAWWMYATLPAGVPSEYVAIAAAKAQGGIASIVGAAIATVLLWLKEYHYRGLLRDMPWRHMPPLWITFLQPQGLWWVVELRGSSVILLGPQGQRGICSFSRLLAAIGPAGGEEAA